MKELKTMRQFFQFYLDEQTIEILKQDYNMTKATMNSNVKGYTIPMPRRLIQYCKGIAKSHSKPYRGILLQALKIISRELQL